MDILARRKGVDEKGIAMPSIASLFGLLEQMDNSKIAVKQNRCILVRNRNVECLRCLHACTTGCIAFDEKSEEVRVSPEKCIACGACATACPTGALVPKDPDDSHLLMEITKKCEACDGYAVVACESLLERAEGLYDPQKVTKVPCLGRIDESMIMALVAMGAKEIALVSGECSSCDHSQGMKTTVMVAENASTLLQTWGSEARLRITGKLPSRIRRVEAPEYDVSKRAFFEGAGKSAVRSADQAASMALADQLGVEKRKPAKYAKVRKDGTLPQFVPYRRRRLNSALKALGKPADEMIETRLWGHVVIDSESCSACRMCATFCPTGALSRFDDEGGVSGISHAPSLCVKCRLCEGLCPSEAIEISELVFASDMIKGEVERFEMEEPQETPNSPHQIHRKVKGLLGVDFVFEK